MLKPKPYLLWLACAICLAGHIYLGFALGLSVDEAHYALYALHPALSYFDHPPLVGWVQMPFVWASNLWAAGDWLMRASPLALWGVTAWALWRFSVWALILFLLSPMHQLLGLALVPDTLLLPLTLWVMVLTWKLSFDISRKSYWLWLGVALGLAGLTKYTGVFLALGVAMVLLPQYGALLVKQSGVWLAALIAMVLIAPVLLWNAQHDWVSFAYQINHADGNTNAWQAKRVLAYGAVQLIAYGLLPLIGLLVYLLRLRKKHVELTRVCLAFGLPLLLVTLWLSSKGAALPHWTAGAWLALLPLSALGLQYLWSARKAAWVLICGLGAWQVLLIAAVGFFMLNGGQWQGQSLFKTHNPFADLHDWQAASVKARALQTEHHANALAVSNWTLASRLAWYARPAKVLALDGKNKQFELWFGALEYGQSFIWVDWSQMPLLRPVGCRKLDGEAGTYKGAHANFDFYLCTQP
ncbi:MAG: glycosyltransferase family 39 protein [Cytophagales bacterium]|nr:glycosyltransferase family 39 protein [Cytophagales bacterium]